MWTIPIDSWIQGIHIPEKQFLRFGGGGGGVAV
jgi:hypothetical protein